MSEIIVIKTQETRDGVMFRVIKNGKFMFLRKSFNNYFYIKKDVYDINKDVFSYKFGFCIKNVVIYKDLVKLIFSNNFMRQKVRNYWEDIGAKTFEADVRANKRFLLDVDIPLLNEKVPYAFYDIETDDRLPLQKDDRGLVIPGDAKILSYSSVNYKGEQVFYYLKEYTDSAEKEMLELIIKDFAKYGVISGWSSRRFDMPYIKGRCDALKLKYNILDYVNHLDYMELFKKYDKKSRPSFSLNAISNEVLHESKIDQAKGNGAIYETWKNDLEHLKKYNIEDSNLIYKINLKRKFIEISMKRADRAGCHIGSTLHNSDSGDYLLLRGYQ